jgi:hypothetical protein
MRAIRLGAAAPVLLVAALAGCSRGPEVGTVEGVVEVNGRPAARVRVEFHPDAQKGTRGPSSFGETDASGHFTLAGGVAVGWHKVVVQDLRLAESATGRGVPVRFGPEYAGVLTTPLDVEVKPGAQAITLKVPKE